MKKKLLRDRELQELQQRLEVAVEHYRVTKTALEKQPKLEEQPKKRGRKKND